MQNSNLNSYLQTVGFSREYNSSVNCSQKTNKFGAGLQNKLQLQRSAFEQARTQIKLKSSNDQSKVIMTNSVKDSVQMMEPDNSRTMDSTFMDSPQNNNQFKAVSENDSSIPQAEAPILVESLLMEGSNSEQF